jgi:hypothetical protein
MKNEDLDHQTILLVFHGLDTIAEIFLNNQQLGSANNMFIRYRFDVKSRLVQVCTMIFFCEPILITHYYRARIISSLIFNHQSRQHRK